MADFLVRRRCRSWKVSCRDSVQVLFSSFTTHRFELYLESMIVQCRIFKLMLMLALMPIVNMSPQLHAISACRNLEGGHCHVQHWISSVKKLGTVIFSRGRIAVNNVLETAIAQHHPIRESSENSLIDETILTS